MMRPIIGITMGDPAGIGPEIIAKALADEAIYETCKPLVFADMQVMQAAIRIAGVSLNIRPVASVDEARFEYGTIDVYDMKNVDMASLEYGKLSANAGNAAFESIRKVIDFAMNNIIDATVTAPINKEAINMAGRHFSGHTEIYAHFTDTKKYAMLLADESLRIIHATTHVPLREACNLITRERILDVVALLHNACISFGIPQPKIGVAGLNPHAGDGGLFGKEDMEIIAPAIQQAQASGYRAEGPVPPDTLFAKATQGKYDGCVAMYHDQGHIPFKLLGFKWNNETQSMDSVKGVNITLGLPIIRTSVDHGTAFEIAGKGVASPDAMTTAIEYAVKMASNKNMLTIIADDITGAAEIAGVCLRYGLRVTFDFDFNMQRKPSTDVWIIATDTRSLSEKEACNVMRTIACRLTELQIKTVFKKIDSALRGHILPELEALLEYIPAEKIFILPANPETGRTIKDGVYHINELPLHQTSFADDPDFPAKTSLVREILNISDTVLPCEIITPDILNQDDYINYAQKINAGCIPVGGSLFFEAGITRFFPSARPNIAAPQPLAKERSILMICGSAHETSKQFIRDNKSFRLLEITPDFVDELLDEPENLRVWVIGAAFIFKECKRLIITVRIEDEKQASAERVKELLSKITAELINRCAIDELLIEGGATAFACMKAANLAALIPVQEYARGIVRFKISGKDNMHITIKPGSYEWSNKLFIS